MLKLIHSFFSHRLRLDVGFLSSKRVEKGKNPHLALTVILPWLSLLFLLSWHGDMHDKSSEANCELCLGLYRKREGFSGAVNQQQLCCRQDQEQWPQTRLALGKLSQPAISLAQRR